VIALESRKLDSNQAVAPIATPRSGMFERSTGVLVETWICRSRRSARGLEVARESERSEV
jgi:hypothetical protein